MPPRTTIDIPLSGGLQQKRAQPYLDGSSLISAQNAIWLKQNAIEKRPGWIGSGNATAGAVPQTIGNSTIPFIQGVFSDGQGYAPIDGFSVYSEPTSSGMFWRDYVSPCVGTRQLVSGSPNGVKNPDVAEWTTGGMRVYVWEDNATAFGGANGNAILYAIVSTSDGTNIAQGIVSKSTLGYSPKIICVGSTAVLFFSGKNQTGILYTSTLDLTMVPANTSWTTPVAPFLSNVTAGSWSSWDVTPMCVQNVAVNGFTPGYMGAVAFPYSPTAYEIFVFNIVAGIVTSMGHVTWSDGSGTPKGVGVSWLGGNGTSTRIWMAYASAQASSAPLLVRFGSWTVTVTSNTTVTIAAESPPTTSNTAITNNSSSSGYSNRSIAICDISQYPADDANPAALITASGSGADGSQESQWVTVYNTGGFGAVYNGFGTQMLSKPFPVQSADTSTSAYGVRVFALMSGTEAQQSAILCELEAYGGAGSSQIQDSPRPVCVIAPRLTSSSGIGFQRSPNTLANVTNPGVATAGKYASVHWITETSNLPTSMAAMGCLFDFTHPGRFKSVRLGNLTYTSGGCPQIFDGVSAVESSTLQTTQSPPRILSSSAPGGNLISTAAYNYTIVPEWRDARGNVHQGPPCTPVVVIAAGTGTGTNSLTVPCISMTKKGLEYRTAVYGQSQMYLVPYRTAVVGGTYGGTGFTYSTTFYRLVGDNPGFAYANVEGAENITFSDSLDDATLITHPPLYTTGGIYEADSPSSFADICTHNGRIYGIGDDLRTVWISTQQVDGQPCYFSDLAQFEESSIGNLTAIWGMDGNLFVGSPTGISYRSGSGPNLNNSQNDLSAPTLIPTDVGPIDPRAVCVTPLGTVFRYAYGLALLDRSLSIHADFGDPVIDLLTQYPTTTAILMHPTRSEILVFCAGKSGGCVLAYNTRFAAWSSWLITDPDAGGVPATPNAAMATANSVVFGTPYGRIFREAKATDPTPWFDQALGATNAWVTWTVSTGWIKPGAGLQPMGWVRNCLVLFEQYDWSDLSVSVGYDYAKTLTSPPSWYFQSQGISGFADVNGVLGSRTRLGLIPPTARCSAFRFAFSDAQPNAAPIASTGQSARIIGLAVEMDALPGLNRLPGNQGA